MWSLIAPVLSPTLQTATQEPLVAPVIAPASAPAYVPDTQPYLAPSPVVAPPPDGQFRGEGGTSFGLIPQVYERPYVTVQPGTDPLYGGPAVATYWNGEAVPTRPLTPPRPGEESIMPVPKSTAPTRSYIAPTQAPVVPVKPGPIQATVLGFDLSVIPLWTWLLAGGALVYWKMK